MKFFKPYSGARRILYDNLRKLESVTNNQHYTNHEIVDHFIDALHGDGFSTEMKDFFRNSVFKMADNPQNAREIARKTLSDYNQALDQGERALRATFDPEYHRQQTSNLLVKA